MSRCISPHGEYSDHVVCPTGPFYCARCLVIDEQSIDAALEAAALAVEAVIQPTLALTGDYEDVMGYQHATQIIRSLKAVQ